MDQSPTALFDSYEQDFKGIVAGVKSKLDGDASTGSAGTYA
jgi:vesicle transport through interaction with t-SNAREs protein 1